MNKKVVFLYPGQGSQYYNMFDNLIKKDKTFSFWMNKLNDIYKEISGFSVLSKLYDKKRNYNDKFEELEYTHPSIYMIQYSVSQVLIERGVKPDGVIASSLGELAASSIAGMTNYKDMLFIINKQVELIKSKCNRGGMVAVIDNYENYIYDENIMQYGSIASINFDNHFVISASENNLERIENYLKDRQVTCFHLPVNYAFHSSEMNNIKEGFMNFANMVEYKLPVIKYYSTTTGNLVNNIDSTYLWKVICKPMNLIKLFRNFNFENYIFIDIGPSATMSNFVKYNNISNSKIQNYAINNLLVDELTQIDKIVKKINEERL